MPLIVTEIEKGFNATRKRLESVDNAVVSAGLFTADQAQKGAWMEFGASTIPARPWLSVAADDNQALFGREMGDAVSDVCDGESTRTALNEVGELMADTIADSVRLGHVDGPDLAPSTVARKGHDTKLIDSGDMIQSVDYEVSHGSR